MTREEGEGGGWGQRAQRAHGEQGGAGRSVVSSSAWSGHGKCCTVLVGKGKVAPEEYHALQEGRRLHVALSCC
jgi:hypothetical protein